MVALLCAPVLGIFCAFYIIQWVSCVYRRRLDGRKQGLSSLENLTPLAARQRVRGIDAALTGSYLGLSATITASKLSSVHLDRERGGTGKRGGKRNLVGGAGGLNVKSKVSVIKHTLPCAGTWLTSTKAFDRW